MNRYMIVLFLWCSAALAGDYVHLPSGRVAFDRADRKYANPQAVRAGWRPVVRAALPPEAFAEVARRGRLDLATWDVSNQGQVSAKDPGALDAGVSERELGRKAGALETLLALRALESVPKSNLPTWATVEVLGALEKSIRERRTAALAEIGGGR